MGSKKRSAQRRQVAAFHEELAGLDLGAAFERERQRESDRDERREAAQRQRSCERKQRYATRGEALDAIAACAEHGRVGLSCYRCNYCHGWHLTSHPWD